VALVAAPLLGIGLFYLVVYLADMEQFSFILVFVLQALPGLILFLAGVGYQKLAWRLFQTLAIGGIAGGAVAALLGAGSLVLILLALVPRGPGSDWAGVGAMVISVLIGCAIYTVFLVAAFWRFVWRHRGEFQRQRLSLLLLVAACGAELGALFLTAPLRHLFWAIFGHHH
jgi:hypothetical protein